MITEREKSILKKKQNYPQQTVDEIEYDDKNSKQNVINVIQDRLAAKKYVSSYDQFKQEQNVKDDKMEIKEFDKFNKFNYGAYRPDSKLAQRVEYNQHRWND